MGKITESDIPDPFMTSETPGNASDFHDDRSRLDSMPNISHEEIPFPFELPPGKKDNNTVEEHTIAVERIEHSMKSISEHQNSFNDVDDRKNEAREKIPKSVREVKKEIRLFLKELRKNVDLCCKKCNKNLNQLRESVQLKTHVGIHFSNKTHACSHCKLLGSYSAVYQHCPSHRTENAVVTQNKDPRAWISILNAMKECFSPTKDLTMKNEAYEEKIMENEEEAVKVAVNPEKTIFHPRGKIYPSDKKAISAVLNPETRNAIPPEGELEVSTGQLAVDKFRAEIKMTVDQIKRGDIVCNVCKKRFARTHDASYRIKLHIGSHFKIRTHSCSMCSYIGSDRATTIHISRHEIKAHKRRLNDPVSWRSLLNRLKICFRSSEKPENLNGYKTPLKRSENQVKADSEHIHQGDFAATDPAGSSTQQTVDWSGGEGAGLSTKLTMARILTDPSDKEAISAVLNPETRNAIPPEGELEVSTGQLAVEKIRAEIKMTVDQIRRGNIVCNICTKRIISASERIIRHIGSHFEIRTHSCSVCSYIGSYNGALSHISRHARKADKKRVNDPSSWRRLLNGLEICFSSSKTPDHLNSKGHRNPVKRQKIQVKVDLENINQGSSVPVKAVSPDIPPILPSFEFSPTTDNSIEETRKQRRKIPEVIKKTCKLCASLLPKGVTGEVFTELESMLAHFEIHRSMSVSKSDDIFADCFS